MLQTESPANPKCALCGREISDTQRVEHRGATYCPSCVGRAINGVLQKQEAGHSPFLAFMLSLIPGLGQLYNRQVKKGIVLAIFFFSLPVVAANLRINFLLSLTPVIMTVTYFWNLFDAYSVAKLIRDSKKLVPDIDLKHIDLSQLNLNDWKPEVELPNMSLKKQDTPSPAAMGFGVLLIILGVLFLLNNFGVEWLTQDRLWPTAMLALGLWLIFSFSASRWSVNIAQRPAPPASPPPSTDSPAAETNSDGDDHVQSTD